MKAFTFLTDPIFSEASDFSEGYAEVVHTQYITGGEVLKTGTVTTYYFTYEGKFYPKQETSPDMLPKLEIKNDTFELFPFQENNLWGYKDSANKIAIDPKFDEAEQFVNGFAKVGIKKHYGKERYYSRPLKKWLEHERTTVNWGLINASGKLVLPADFIEIENVINNIVKYKRFVYFEWQYYNGFDYNMREVAKGVPLYGYMIYDELIPSIEKMTKSLDDLHHQLSDLKIRHEIDSCFEKIKKQKAKIELLNKTKVELETN